MSLTNDVKHELCECTVPADGKNVFRYGLFYGFRGAEPFFLTYDRTIANYVKRSLPKELICTDTSEHGKRTAYCISVISDEIQKDTGCFGGEIDTSRTGGSDAQIGLFLRGVFLTCGNVYVQKAGYHLEFPLHDEQKCRSMYRLINEQGMRIDLSHRNGKTFLYTKDSENISDILTFIGATNSAMEIMNIKILKEVRSNINRSVNCETANIGRTVKASSKQADDIKLIFEKLGADRLPDDLREIALLRLSNPDMSLRDLGLLAEPKISRSGVNHRFERIAKLAGELRNEKDE